VSAHGCFGRLSSSDFLPSETPSEALPAAARAVPLPHAGSAGYLGWRARPGWTPLEPERGVHDPGGRVISLSFLSSAVKNLVDSSVYFRSVEGLLRQAISIRDHMNATAQGHR
jgi:hypothetical protein